MKVIPLLGILVAASLMTAGNSSASTVASAAKKGAAVAYAHVNATSQTISTFGGKGTTGAATSACSASQCTVTFTGKYPDDITTDNVIAFAGSEAGNYSVANYLVAGATPTTITIIVATFESDTTTGTTNAFYVSAFIGKVPAP